MGGAVDVGRPEGCKALGWGVVPRIRSGYVVSVVVLGAAAVPFLLLDGDIEVLAFLIVGVSPVVLPGTGVLRAGHLAGARWPRDVAVGVLVGQG